MYKIEESVELNRRKLAIGKFSWKDLGPDVQKKVPRDAKVYALKLREWVQVGGYEVLLDEEASHNDVPMAKLVLKYPPTISLHWLKNFLTPLQKAIWVYDSCMIPFTNMFISKWHVGDGSSDGAFLVAFKESAGHMVISG